MEGAAAHEGHYEGGYLLCIHHHWPSVATPSCVVTGALLSAC
jgi:hypothetical protein